MPRVRAPEQVRAAGRVLAVGRDTARRHRDRDQRARNRAAVLGLGLVARGARMMRDRQKQGC